MDHDHQSRLPHRWRRSPVGGARESLGRNLFSEADWLALARTLGLTKRQVQVAKLLCEELTYGGMAMRLNISVNTVRMHMRSLFSRLNVRDRVGVVLRLALVQRRLEKA